MKSFITILLIAGLIFSCNSNKGKSAFGKKKRHNYSASRPAPQNNNVNNNSNSKTPIVSEKTVNPTPDSLEIEEENSWRRNRPRTHFQGASGVGTGGSYASSYYRRKEMKQKNKKDIYKDRNFDHMYQDQNTAHLVKKDTSKVNLENINEFVQEEDSSAVE
jgi:hypothetical protein